MRRETGSRRPLDRNRREWRPVPTPLVPCELPGAVDKAKAAEEEDVADETRADEAAAVTARSLTPSPGPQARVVGVVAGQPRR